MHAFQELVDGMADEMGISADPHFAKKDWLPTNLKLCPRGTWNRRMLIETLLSILTLVCHLKQLSHRVWAYFETQLAFTMVLFNILVMWMWHGIEPEDDGLVYLSIAFGPKTRVDVLNHRLAFPSHGLSQSQPAQ